MRKATELLEYDPSVILALDRDLRIAYCNRAWDEFAAQNGGDHLRREVVCGLPVLDLISGELATFYRQLYGAVLETNTPCRHAYECSSLERFRRFAMHVYPASGWRGLIVVHSLVVDEPNVLRGEQAIESAYRQPDGIIVMCSNCRRTRRKGDADTWDWVPGFVSTSPAEVSHGLCQPCSEHYHLNFVEVPPPNENGP